MTPAMEPLRSELTDVQRQAVDWEDGPLLVLAGPGAGKTRVLTCRIARILNDSRDHRFRVLALTFTNKAANEMAGRVATLASGLSGRADIDTFHGFCTQVLRQHGMHLGIRSDFAIYSRTADRRAILEDALLRDRANTSTEDMRLLPLIDQLKAQLVEPEQASRHFEQMLPPPSDDPARVERVYRLYEEELRRANALDFNSLILQAYRLFGYPAFAKHYRRVYRHWMIDEFQDTNGAQYALLRRMAHPGFPRLFAVADDDQTIFEWNGASVRRIGHFVRDFSCQVLQLPTNFRCPQPIVDAANRLVVYNAARLRAKRQAKSAPGTSCPSTDEQIGCRVFDSDADEAEGIAAEIALSDDDVRSRACVLARNRRLLSQVQRALVAKGVSAVIAIRRDDFVSPQMRWLVASLRQIARPMDRHNLGVLVETFNEFCEDALNVDDLVWQSAADGVTFLASWLNAVRRACSAEHTRLVEPVAEVARGGMRWNQAVKQVLARLQPDGERNGGADQDILDDLNAWRRISREVRAARGATSLDQFLQELQLRSKEPARVPGTVTLATIHGAKGLEFDTVYLIGLAEGVLPSWHSVQKGNGGAAIEEERRSCFVAITRTRRRLVLSRAKRYRGWSKQPSRFLEEMGCGCGDASGARGTGG